MSFEAAFEKMLKNCKSTPSEMMHEIICNFTEDEDFDAVAVFMTRAADTRTPLVCDEFDRKAGAVFRKVLESYLAEAYPLEWNDTSAEEEDAKLAAEGEPSVSEMHNEWDRDQPRSVQV